QSYAIAFIQPIEKEIRALAGQLGTPGLDVDHLDYQDLCARKDINAAVLNSLKECAKLANFKPAEILGQIHLCYEEWTPQNEMLTAAMKLQRNAVVKKFEKEAKAMYAS
ncbi:long-chain fatty acid-CoA ligase, partial [Rhizoclosmatium hyalinum]